MKRICLVVAAMAALLTVAVTVSASAAPAAKKSVKTSLSCTLKLATQIPSNDVTVTQGAESGTQYGRAGCGKPLFSGVEESSFVQDESGDLAGKYQQWFNAGSVYGTYTLSPGDTGPPTTSSFTNASYTGTATVTGGTGVFKKVTGKAKLTCTTTDLAHYACTEKLTLIGPALAK